ncbi:MAG: acetylxylan esterase [Kiritimatiellia bacterium]
MSRRSPVGPRSPLSCASWRLGVAEALLVVLSLLTPQRSRASDRASDVSKVDVVGADFAATQVMGDGAWDKALITGTTPGGKMFYARGEEIEFSLKLEGVEKELPSGVYFADWVRTGDDGVRECGREPLPFKGGRFVYRTRGERPGFVCLEVNVVTADGRRVKKKHRWEPRVFFMGGVGVAPDEIPMAPEPSDYARFWRESLDELAAVPMEARLRPVACADPQVRLFSVRIPCAGPWPVTGYLTVPCAASVSNRMPAAVDFRGASQQEQLPPTRAAHDRLSLCINPNGYELGRGPEYVRAFFAGLSENGAGYGMGPKANADRRTSYWKYCALRAVRAVQWMKTRPEWDGRSLNLAGGSQGDWQAYHAAANVPGVTQIDADGSWGADWGGQELFGRLKSSYRPRCWFPDMAYFDPIYAARRIRCPVRIYFAGLGDYCSTPASLTLLYRNLAGPKSITYVQGSTHGWRPAGQQQMTLAKGLAQPSAAESMSLSAASACLRRLLASGDVVYHLDASCPGTVETRADGSVVRWRSVRGDCVFESSGRGAATTARWGDRAVVAFRRAQGARLVAAREIEHRTVFVVCRPSPAAAPLAGVWGGSGIDVGLRLSGRADSWEHVGGGPDFNTAETLLVNGRAMRGDAPIESNAVQVVALRHPEDRTRWNVRSCAQFRPSVGGYLGGRGFDGEVAEVLALRTVLSESDCQGVLAALRAKWEFADGPERDVAARVRAALAGGERIVRIPKGSYRAAAGAGRAALTLTGLSDRVIDFSGSEIRFAGAGAFVALVACTNVAVREAKVAFVDASAVASAAVHADGCVGCVFERLDVEDAPCAFAEVASEANVYRGCRVQAVGSSTGFSVRRAASGPRLLGCAFSAGTGSDMAVEASGGENPDVRGLVARGGVVSLAGTGGRLEDSAFARGCRIEAGAAVCRANETYGEDVPLARADPVAYVRQELARGARRVSVPRARYWLALGPKDAAYFHLSGRRDAELDFNGGELVGTIQAPMFVLSECTNVTVRGAAVDYEALPFTQAVITRVDAERNWDVRVIPGYPRPSAVALASAEAFWPIQAYGAKSHEPVNFMRYRQGVSIVRTGADAYRISGGECRAGEAGDIAVWTCADWTHAPRAGAVNVWVSSGCRIEDVCAYAAANDGCGFAEAIAGGNAYVRCRLVRREPGTDLFPRGLRRLRSGNHDAFNSRRSPVGPLLEDCVFQYHCDDCVNISGCFSFVLGRKGRAYRVAVRAQERLRTGDLCQVLLPDGTSPGDVRLAQVTSAPELTDAERAQFAQLGLWPGCERNFRAVQDVVPAVAADWPPGTLLAPRGRMGEGYRIVGCTMGHNRARGLLLQASRGTVVRNVLEGIEGWAILLAPECTWMEAGIGSHVRIEGNVCRGNGEGIYIGGRSLTGRPFDASTRRDVALRGNRIDGANVAVTGCRELRLEGNDIRPRQGQKAVSLVNVRKASR